MPALAVTLAASARPQLAAMLAGLSGYALGLLLSALFDLPSGAVIVWSIMLVSLIYIAVFGARPARE